MAFGYSMTAFVLALLATALWFGAGGGILPGVAIYVIAGQMTLCLLLLRAAYWHQSNRIEAQVPHN